MQTLVYIIGGYCLIKAVFIEGPMLAAIFTEGEPNWRTIMPASGNTALLFLSAIEAFNQ